MVETTNGRRCPYCKNIVSDINKHIELCRNKETIDYSVAKNCSKEVANKYIEVANSLSTKHISNEPTWSEIKRRNHVKFY